jgi:hypothetical protein
MTRAGNVFGLPGAIFGCSEYDGDFQVLRNFGGDAEDPPPWASVRE